MGYCFLKDSYISDMSDIFIVFSLNEIICYFQTVECFWFILLNEFFYQTLLIIFVFDDFEGFLEFNSFFIGFYYEKRMLLLFSIFVFFFFLYRWACHFKLNNKKYKALSNLTLKYVTLKKNRPQKHYWKLFAYRPKNWDRISSIICCFYKKQYSFCIKSFIKCPIYLHED